LNEEQAREFISFLKDESALLREVRVEPMTKSKKTIAKIIVNGDFLYPGTKESVDTAKDTEFGSDTVELSTELIRGNFRVLDTELEDNIEGKSLGQKLMSLIAKKTANELEKVAVYSRKRANPLRVREMFDGFKEGHVVDAATGFADRLVKREKFVKAVKSMPTNMRDGAKFFVSNSTKIDYTEQYVTVADQAVKQDITTSIAGQPNTVVNLISEYEPVLVSGGASTTTTGAVAVNATVIPVTSATGIIAGKTIVTDFGTEKEQVHTVASVAALNVTVVDPIKYAIDSGATVKEATLDGADALYTNPKNLIYGIQVGGDTSERITFEMERIH
jgi:hypothetical protein